MKLNIRRKLSQISFLAVTAVGLSTGSNAFATESMSEIDSNAVSQHELYAPAALDEEYVPLDGEFSSLDGHDGRRRRGDRTEDGRRDRGNRWRREVVACYSRDWRGQAYVAYNENMNARRAQRQAVRYCEQVSGYRCQALGCRREWVNSSK